MKKIYSSPKTIVLQLKHRSKLLSGSPNLRMRGKDATESAMAPDQEFEDFDE